MTTQSTSQQPTSRPEDDAAVGEQRPFDLKNLPDEITGRAREIWLAGLGALSRVEEEGDKIFRDLVQRGESYEARRRQQLEGVTSGLRERQEALTHDVTERLENATESVDRAVSDTLSGTLGRIGVPTRTEVRGLSRKVGELSKKLDALSQMLEPEATEGAETVLHVVPREDGWAVMREGADDAQSVHPTKKEALSAGRRAAKEHVPSQLIVHKQDRSVQESYSYTEDDV